MAKRPAARAPVTKADEFDEAFATQVAKNTETREAFYADVLEALRKRDTNGGWAYAVEIAADVGMPDSRGYGRCKGVLNILERRGECETKVVAPGDHPGTTGNPRRYYRAFR